jgi:Tol biopolymer transport system component/DNA-binding winged helix-turn-helix (wHTH) protein
MGGADTRRPVYRFGSFELETEPRELRKQGTRIKLQDQPLQILVLLLEHAGEVVTREQIQNKLWPPGTYVDYDNAINSAMRKLREALCDDSGDPRFIETFARRGYRFIGAIEVPPRPDREPPTPAPRKSRRGLIAGVCATVVLAAAVGGWWLLRPRVETKVVPLTPVPLTAAPGWEFDPSLSPDGNQVAYAWREGEDVRSHIYVKVIGEGKPLPLTTGPQSDECPAWSPDGRTIAFVRFSGPPTIRIYVVPALGGAERQVAEGPFGCVTGIAWSPDGRFLAVAENHAQPDSSSLSLVRVEDGDKLVLTKPPDAKTADSDPAFSPDGRLLLFTRCVGNSHCGLYLLDLAAGYQPVGGPRLLRQESVDVAGATWTANGREVVYALSAGNRMNYHLMRVRAEAGSQPQPLAFTGERSSRPAIAPRGNRLAYTQDLWDSDIWQVQPGKRPRSFVSSTRMEYAPQYSPDGKHVAFSSDRSGLLQIWVCDGDGGNPAQLTRSDAGASGTPRWSPDGRWIAFDHHEKERWRIYVMASDGGQVRRLAKDEGDIEVIPSWSGDGKWIYYASNRTGRFEIWKRAAQGGQGMQLTHNGGWVAFESHDGRSLYYTNSNHNSGRQGEIFTTTKTGGLWVLPLGGGEEKQVVESVWYRAFAVMDDGIYYIPAPAANGGSVRFHSFATGEDKEVSSIGQPTFQGLSVSPDRKTILFSAEVQTGSNIMVADSFR